MVYLFIRPHRDGLLAYSDKPVMLKRPFYDFVLLRKEDLPRGMKAAKVAPRRIMGTNKVEDIAMVVLRDEWEKQEVLRTLSRRRIPYDYISYNERLAILKPDFVRVDFKEKIMVFDIEVVHKGSLMGDPNKDAIVTIAYSINEDIKSIYSEGDEKKLLTEFLEILKSERPNIVTGYYIKGFDIPYLLQRALALGIDEYVEIFQPSVANHRYKYGIIVDTLELVQSDQVITTSGIENLGLKTVARYFGYDAIEIDHSTMWSIVFDENGNYRSKDDPEIQRLLKYNESDVRVTEAIFNIYYPRYKEMAESLALPLDDIVNGYTSMRGQVVLGRVLRESKIVSLGTNRDRYGSNGYIAKLGESYRGAIVETLKFGLMKDVYKFDFASQYPSTIVSLNIGPDTTRLLKVEPMGEDEPDDILDVVKKTDDYIIVMVRDSVLKKRLYIKISRKPSKLRDMVIELFNRRKELKALMKEAQKSGNRTEYEKYYSQQWAVKVQMNSIYGNMGQMSFRYGDYVAAILITAYARDVTRFVKSHFGDAVIAIDTDGLYVQGKFSEEEVNAKIDEYLKEKYGFEHRMYLEEEGYWPKMYVQRMKNYVLMDKDGNLTFHGAVFKSSGHSKLYKDFVREVVRKIMDEEDIYPVIIKYFSMERYPRDMFVQRMKVVASSSYDDKSRKQKSIARQFEEQLGKEIVGRQSVEYIVTGLKEDDKIYTIADVSPNYSYYAKLLRSFLDEVRWNFSRTSLEYVIRRIGRLQDG